MIDAVKNALLSVSDRVYAYTSAGNSVPPYILYGMDGTNHLMASGKRAELCDTGYIELYTKEEEDELIAKIPEALETFGISFYLNSVQFEEETGLLHYEWIWEAV